MTAYFDFLTLLTIETYHFVEPVFKFAGHEWLLYALMLCCLPVAILFFTRRQYMVFLPEAMISDVGMNKFLNDRKLISSVHGLLMFMTTSCVEAVMIYEIVLTFDLSALIPYDGIMSFFVILAAVVAIPVAKLIIGAILLILFDIVDVVEPMSDIHITNGFGFSLIALPLMFINTYIKHNILSYIVMAMFLIMLTSIFIRQLIQGFRYRKLSNIYFFIYLCILKFLPVAALTILLQ